MTASPPAWTTAHRGQRIVTSRVDHLLIVRFAHEPVNALDLTGYRELGSLTQQIADDNELRAVVMLSEGPGFSAGQDRGDSGLLAQDPGGYLTLAASAINGLLSCPVPLVCGVRGFAVGAGLIIASSADVLVMSDSAVLSLPEVDVGVVGGLAHLTSVVGRPAALQAALTGLRIPTDVFTSAGVDTVDDPRVDETAMALAQAIATKDPRIVAAIMDQRLQERRALAGAYRAEIAATIRGGLVNFGRSGEPA
jgi:enoyl-CoA hydratase/carnithine racemase